MKNVIRIVSLLLYTVLFGLVPTEVAWAQAVSYTFTRIADTNQDSGLGGVSCVGINNLGTVIVTFSPTGSANLELWRGDGDGQPFTQVAQAITGLCASINDLGETAYARPHADPQINQVFLVRNSNGNVITLADSINDGFHSGTTYLPSINNSGSVLFQYGFGGDGISVAPFGPNVVSPNSFPFDTAGTMNDSNVVAFLAIRPDASIPTGSRVGIYRGSLVPLVEDGNPNVSNVNLNRPVINNSGTIAFVGIIAGSAYVLKTDDGVNFTAVSSAVDANNARPAINNHGWVAYRSAANYPPGDSILASPDASVITHRVIGHGQDLDGSKFVSGLTWEESLNDNGQIAFYAQLEDGRRGVYRADPVTNSAPVLAPIGNKTVKKDDLLTFTATATDPDLPANTLTFSLGLGAPAGAVINSSTGLFSWTPTKNQGPGNYPVTIRVTDSGNPVQSDLETITITVLKKGGKPQ